MDDNCFIGTHVVIIKDVTIGNHCLVGANAVVSKSFPDYSIILGVPGKLAGKVIVTNEEVQLEYFNY